MSNSRLSIGAAHLQELVRQVRSETVRVLAAADEGWLTWSPPGTSNHILWHAGHSLWVGDVLGVELIIGQSELPQGWAETFGMDCRPVKETKQWPSRAGLDRLLRQQALRLIDLLGRLPAERLAIPAGGDGSQTLAGEILHGLHDEAKHQGEMYLLYKMCRAMPPQPPT
jgi:hypothetical protein